jgi:glutamate/aspartate transport system substrate-binding protein
LGVSKVAYSEMRAHLRLIVLLATLALVAWPAASLCQPATPLSATSSKVKQTSAIALGYRVSSPPFSYVLQSGAEPIGYSIDLCREVVSDIARDLDTNVKIAFVPVTPSNRLQKIMAGEIDLECGSTTNNSERRAQVAFSPIIFVAGTQLLVPKTSPIDSFKALAGRSVAVTAGTTNEQVVRRLAATERLRLEIRLTRDHDESLALLSSGKVDAFVTDGIILRGLTATHEAEFKLVGELLSVEPYGLPYRLDDPYMTAAIDRTFARLASAGQLKAYYDRWFMGPLPGGQALNLPMSPLLAETFRKLGQP